jgi:hypothetical protein
MTANDRSLANPLSPSVTARRLRQNAPPSATNHRVGAHHAKLIARLLPGRGAAASSPG